MGLLWSMAPPRGDADRDAFRSRDPQAEAAFEVRLTASAGDAGINTTLRRRWLLPGVTHRPLALASDGLIGDLYLPAGDRTNRPVLVFGGSEGGNAQKWTAALLASHGHPALSLAYFGEPGLPPTLNDVPLEYFTRAARLLGGRTGTVAVVGYSRGTEAALLLAQRHPDLIGGVVVYAPTDLVYGGYPEKSRPAWTDAGRAVPLGRIAVDRVSGPVLAITGGEDRLWDSTGAAGAWLPGFPACSSCTIRRPVMASAPFRICPPAPIWLRRAAARGRRIRLPALTAGRAC